MKDPVEKVLISIVIGIILAIPVIGWTPILIVAALMIFGPLMVHILSSSKKTK